MYEKYTSNAVKKEMTLNGNGITYFINIYISYFDRRIRTVKIPFLQEGTNISN